MRSALGPKARDAKRPQRYAVVAATSALRRSQGSDVRPLNEGAGRVPYLVKVALSHYLKWALTFDETVACVEPLPHAPGGQRVREQDHQIAQVGEAVIPLRADCRSVPAAYGPVAHARHRSHLRLGNAVPAQRSDDLISLYGSP